MTNDDCLQTWTKKDFKDLMRRKNRRQTCHSSLTGSLFRPGTLKTMDVWVVDLSTVGVGVIASVDVAVGEDVIIKLKRTKAISMIPFHASVLHCTSESECCVRIGCRFKEPIDPVLWEYLIG